VGSSSLSGTVTDPSGAAVPNASVTLNSADRSFTRTAVTGPGGNYEIPTLPPGRFRIKVAAKGFVSQETEPLNCHQGKQEL